MFSVSGVSGVSGVSEALSDMLWNCTLPIQFWLNLVGVKMIAKQERQCQLNVLFS